MKTSFSVIGLSLLTILLTSGCKTTDSGASSASDGRNYRRTDRIEKVWLKEGFDFKGYEALWITPTTSEGITPRDGKEEERLVQMRNLINRNLAAELEDRQLFPSVTRREADLTGKKALRLNTSLINFSRGSTAARWTVGFGSGMPYARVRGEVVENGSQEPLLIFEIDERGDWFGTGFESTKSIQNRAGEELAQDVADFISRVTRGEKIRYR